MTTRALTPLVFDTHPPALARPDFSGVRLFQKFLRATVPLWLLGALAPAAVLVLLKLVCNRWPRGLAANLVSLSWIATGITQAIAALLFGISSGEIGQGLRTALSFSVIGWVFGGLAIAAGASHRLDDARIVRAITLLGGFILLGGLVTFLCSTLLGMSSLVIDTTPFALLLPASKAVSFYTSVQIFQTEETFGENMLRMVLFFPWTTSLGLGGLTIAFISTREKSLPWRLLGIAGGIVGVVFSWSRIALGALLLIGALLAVLRLPWRWRMIPIGACLLALMALPLAGIDPFARLADSRRAIDGARAGSSQARELIYSASWAGFLRSPVFGNGWVGPSVHPIEELPIGSHSTLYGTLYTGGIMTFAAFTLALLATATTLGTRLLLLPRSDPRWQNTLVAFGLLLALAMYAPYEALYSLTLPTLFLFTWIGASLAAYRAAPGLDPAPEFPRRRDAPCQSDAL